MKLTVLFFALMAAASLPAGKITVSADKPAGIYRVGETVQFRVNAPDGERVRFKVTGPYGRVLQEESFDARSTDKVIEFKITAPGGVRAEASAGKETAETGVLAAPETLVPAQSEPADFDEYWNQAKAQSAAIPLRVLEKNAVEVPAKYTGQYECFDVKLSGVDDTPVSGYLVMPSGAAPGSLPAVVVYHGFGVQSASRHFSFGKAIVFDINVHGLPNGKERAYYQELSRTTLRQYHEKGRRNRHQYYFRNVYLRNLRALEFVRSLPEWDGKNLIAAGGSQGGAQALAAAALDPRVTMCVAAVPAMCDHAGLLAGRESGWPRILRGDPQKIDAKVLENMAYYDNIFFARRIHAPVWISAGLIDRSCSASSIYAVYNQFPAAKNLTVVPDAGHKDPRVTMLALWAKARNADE